MTAASGRGAKRAKALTTTEQRVLDATPANGRGALWYYIGADAYPELCRWKVGIFGQRFVELNGNGANLTIGALSSLRKRGLVVRDAEYRYHRREAKP